MLLTGTKIPGLCIKYTYISRFETSVTNNEIILHAEIENMNNVYLTPAVKRTAQRQKGKLSHACGNFHTVI